MKRYKHVTSCKQKMHLDSRVHVCDCIPVVRRQEIDLRVVGHTGEPILAPQVCALPQEALGQKEKLLSRIGSVGRVARA